MAPSICFCPYFLHWYPSKSGTDVTRDLLLLCCFFFLQPASQPAAARHRSDQPWIIVIEIEIRGTIGCKHIYSMDYRTFFCREEENNGEVL